MKTNLLVSLLSFMVLLIVACSEESSTNNNNNNGKPADTVRIGSQTWMNKNLDIENYRNGDAIPQVTDEKEWAALTTGAWCYFNNDAANGKIYGKLYNWYAVNDPRGLAPTGWHVASAAEWLTLIEYLGDVSIAGGKLKEAGTSHWTAPNEGADNSSGFTALPGGWRFYSGAFNYLGTNTYWWTSTKFDEKKAWYAGVYNDNANAIRNSYSFNFGFSVRCVKD